MASANLDRIKDVPYRRPEEPWLDDVRWVQVLLAPRYYQPQSQVAGLSQTAIFQRLNLIVEEQVVDDAMTWTGLPEMPGFTLCHANKQFAWLFVMEDALYDQMIACGDIILQDPLVKGALPI